MKITGFTAWLVEHEPGPKFIWRDGIPGSHGDIPHGSKPRKAVIRMETDSGLEGVIELGRGDAVIEARSTRKLLQHVGPMLSDSAAPLR